MFQSYDIAYIEYGTSMLEIIEGPTVDGSPGWDFLPHVSLCLESLQRFPILGRAPSDQYEGNFKTSESNITLRSIGLSKRP